VRPWMMAVLLALIAIGFWQRGVQAPRAESSAAPPPRRAAALRPGAALVPVAMPAADTRFTVSGRATDDDSEPVGGLEVVFVGDDGESSVETDAAGRYRIELAAGQYRVLARGDGYVPVGDDGDQVDLDEYIVEPDLVPDMTAAGARALELVRDEDAFDLDVTRSGRLTGTVRDAAGRPIAGAIVHAASEDGVVLATAVAVTDGHGRYELEVPAGHVDVSAVHRDYTGTEGEETMCAAVEAGGTERVDLILVTGCIIEGRVVTARGEPAPPGDMEIQNDGSDAAELPYLSDGRIFSDGRFRWYSTEDVDEVVLRAAPADAPRSAPRRFRCGAGVHVRHAVFVLDDRAPDLQGVIVADGRPVAGVSVAVLGEESRELRSDAEGRWAAYDLPAGDYRVAAVDAAGRSAVHAVVVPSARVVVELAPAAVLTGRVDPDVGNGWIAVELDTCLDEGDPYGEPRSVQVPVVAGRYRIDGVPACTRQVSAEWRTGGANVGVDLVAGQVTTLDFDPVAVTDDDIIY
jgi:hypothetical protein